MKLSDAPHVSQLERRCRLRTAGQNPLCSGPDEVAIAAGAAFLDHGVVMGIWQSIKRAFSGRDDAGSEASASVKKSPRELFAEMVTEEALKNPRVARVEPNPNADFSLHVWPHGANEPWIVYLSNTFEETRENPPEKKRDQIRVLLSSFGNDADISWEEACAVVVPVVRLAGFGGALPVELVSRPLAPGLKLFSVVDHGASMAYVGATQLEKWDVTPEAIFETGIENLANHAEDSDVEPYDVEAPYPTWHITRDDSYESSRLALPGFLASFRSKVQGNPIAIIPERSTLIIAGDGHEDAVAHLARLAEREFRAAPRSISPAVYTVDERGEITPLHLPSAHPHHDLVERGHKLMTATTYEGQEERLKQQLETDGIDVFVAGYRMIAEEATGKITSWAVMPEGVDTLLPVTDVIAICGGDPETGWQFMVPFEKVLELAPGCLERDKTLEPARFRTVGWPDEETLEKLRALAVM